MAEQIRSDKLHIKDVFNMWFRVPEYQRPFVWGTDEVIELLDDVYNAQQSNPESEYFLGSMVLKKNAKQEGTTKYEEYDLLDGQQRLTTLFLITAIVRDMTDPSNESRLKTCKESIYQMAIPDDNVPERLRIIFDIRDKVKAFINTYIKTDKGTLNNEEFKKYVEDIKEDISIRNMSHAILTIKSFFKDHSVDNFFKYFRSQVLMIYVATEELEDAFHLFTVMNNRGIKLRNSDILKAENLAKVDEKSRVDYAKKWEKIETYFSEDFDNFLSHLRTVLVKQKAGYNLLKEFEENIYSPKDYDRVSKTYVAKKPLLIKGTNTLDFIDRYYEHYLKLFDRDNFNLDNSFQFNNYITIMKKGFVADFWISAILRYFDKFKYDNLLDFLKALDKKFSADWLSGLSPTSRIENINKILGKIDLKDTNTPQVLLSSEEFKINKNDLLRAISGNIYGRRFARYILLKLDLLYHGHTSEMSIPVTISIEHILPQNPESESNWVNDFTEEKRNKWANKLGNLVLLSCRKNSSQGNLDYHKKKEKYFKKNVELFSNSVRIYNAFSTWKPNDLEKNHKDVIEKFLSSYEIVLSKDEIEDLCNQV